MEELWYKVDISHTIFKQNVWMFLTELPGSNNGPLPFPLGLCIKWKKNERNWKKEMKEMWYNSHKRNNNYTSMKKLKIASHILGESPFS